jgi:hypothetical protein
MSDTDVRTPKINDLGRAVATLNMILSEIDAPLVVRIKASKWTGDRVPHIVYRGYAPGETPIELKILAWRAFWLLDHSGAWTPTRKKRCFDCWLAEVDPSECEHEPSFR